MHINSAAPLQVPSGSWGIKVEAWQVPQVWLRSSSEVDSPSLFEEPTLMGQVNFVMDLSSWHVGRLLFLTARYLRGEHHEGNMEKVTNDAVIMQLGKVKQRR
jgi:hypothetical protein